MDKYYFTSEAVCCGHPDKICDKISDYILDSALRQDKDSKMAVEATIKDNTIFIYGEANTRAVLDYEKLAKEVVRNIGYDAEFEVIVRVSEQSREIDSAVGDSELMAGDQGIMFGYACLDTDCLMPMPIFLANKLVFELDKLKRKYDFLNPDGKCQVTVEYVDGKVSGVDTVVMAVCHKESISLEKLRKFVIDNVIKKVIPNRLLDDNTKILINTSGSFILGGPWVDSGTTGRKIVCDTYGGMARVGGGCFSSKDPSKVDRSGAYYARYVAKNIVAHGMAEKCEIQVSYTIGCGKAVSLFIECFGTNKVSMNNIYKYVDDNFDFSVNNIVNELDLKKPIYYDLACYGHFGRWDLDLTWENIK